MTDNSERPAFANPGSEYGPGSGGLTKREYFAGLAMQGMIKIFMDKSVSPTNAMNQSKICAQWSVHFADALLDELEKK